MAFKHGRSTKVYYGGHDVSAYLSSASMDVTVDTADTTTFGQDWHTALPGLVSAALDFEGKHDPADTSVGELLQTAYPLTVCPGGGAAIGDAARLAQVISTAYGESPAIDDVVGTSWGVIVDRSLAFGQVLKPLDLRGQNVALNGTFETDATGWVATSGGSIARSTVESRVGAASGRVTANAGSAFSGVVHPLVGTFHQGQTYQVSLWAKLISGDGDCQLVALSTGAGVLVTTGFTATGSWQQVTASFVTGSNLTDVSVSVSHIPASASVVAIDEVYAGLTAEGGAPKDDGASTSTGWTATCHMTYVSLVPWTVKLQDSADGTTFADVSGGSFGAVDAPTAVRLVSPSATSTLRRYVRWSASNASLGSYATFFVAYARSRA